MSWINNQVSEGEVEKLDNNCFELEAKRIDRFGLFPQFALNDSNRVFVVQAVPISGFWGGIMGKIFHWKGKNPREVSVPANEKGGYYPLYTLKEQIGSIIRGCIIPKKRTDEFTEVLRRNNGGQDHYEYKYKVTIEAVINPTSFFNFLKTPNNVQMLLASLENSLLNSIDRAYNDREGDPDFTIELDNDLFDTNLLEEAGYKIDNCTIRYLNRN